MEYTYTGAKFATARKNLVPPHPDGEITSIVKAFHECSDGLHEINVDNLDNEARKSLEKLRELMDTTGLSDPSLGDLFAIKAELLTLDQKTELLEAINYLTSWFETRSGK